MLDPATAIGIAAASWKVLQKGFEVGRSIEEMANDLSRWSNAVDDVDRAHRKAKSRRIGSVNEEALETWKHKRQVQQQEEQLRLLIISRHGVNAYADLIKLRAKIRVERQKELERLKKQREELIQWAAIIGTIFVLFIFVILLLSAIFR